jgi:GTPase SAR1 family protein
MSMDDQNANRDIFNIGSIQGDLNVVNYDKQPRSRQEFNARKRLLNEIRTELAGRKPLHQAAMLNLGKEQQPHQVQRPWDVSVKVGEQRSFQLPSETSILEVFEEPTIGGKLLILGKAGSGKTTTLLELAQRLYDRAEMDSNAPIPLILELSSWKPITRRSGFLGFGKQEETDPPIQDWILSQLQSKGVSKKIGEQWIRYELVLLLDGLDEMQSERQTKCVKAINEFLNSEFSPLYLILCSRKEEYENYEEILHLNGAICLRDLTIGQMRNYFTSINLENFWESIKTSKTIVDFIHQPLFLAITSIACQQIDVEEWKNCNSEQNNIDYLLGIYRIKMLTKTTESNWYKKKQVPELGIQQDRLIRLAITMTKCKFKEFEVNTMNLDWLQSSSQVRLINHICAFLSFFILFLPFILIFKMNLLILLLSYLFSAYFCFSKPMIKGYMQLFIVWLILTPFLAIFPEETLLPYLVPFSITSTILSSLFFFSFPDHDINAVRDMDRNIKSPYSKEEFIHSWGLKGSPTEFLNSDDSITLVLLVFIFFILGFVLGLTYPITVGGLFVFTWIAKFAIGLLTGILLPILLLLSIGFTILIFLILSQLFSVVWSELYNLLRRLTLRLFLGLNGDMPWNITRFLDYCTERLILQRVGKRYRFIHRLVQEHFASLEIQKFGKLN